MQNGISLPDPKSDYKIDHFIKSQTPHFQAVWDGEKSHEIRRNDRDFKVGQIVRLLEWKAHSEKFVGRAVDIIILTLREGTDIPGPGGYIEGIKPGFCVWEHMIVNHFRKEDMHDFLNHAFHHSYEGAN